MFICLGPLYLCRHFPEVTQSISPGAQWGGGCGAGSGASSELWLLERMLSFVWKAFHRPGLGLFIYIQETNIEKTKTKTSRNLDSNILGGQENSVMISPEGFGEGSKLTLNILESETLPFLSPAASPRHSASRPPPPRTPPFLLPLCSWPGLLTPCHASYHVLDMLP